MFERYTGPARRVIFFARYEAAIHAATHIEPEHILLGIVKEQPELLRELMPELALESFGQEMDRVHPGRADYNKDVNMPLSSKSKQVLIFAGQEADRLGSTPLMPQHLLAGLLQLDSLAYRMLMDAGMTREALGKLAQMSPEDQKVFHASFRRERGATRLAVTTKVFLVSLFAIFFAQITVKSKLMQWEARDKAFYSVVLSLIVCAFVACGAWQLRTGRLTRRRLIQQSMVFALFLLMAAGMLFSL